MGEKTIFSSINVVLYFISVTVSFGAVINCLSCVICELMNDSVKNKDLFYLVHPDRLGSYTHITNANKQVIRNLHFDPWGNVKSDTNWLTFDSTTLSGNLAGTFRFSRGFTGHEHYADLKIINMKAPLVRPCNSSLLLPRQLRAGAGVHAELQPVFVLSEQSVAIYGPERGTLF